METRAAAAAVSRLPDVCAIIQGDSSRQKSDSSNEPNDSRSRVQRTQILLSRCVAAAILHSRLVSPLCHRLVAVRCFAGFTFTARSSLCIRSSHLCILSFEPSCIRPCPSPPTRCHISTRANTGFGLTATLTPQPSTTCPITLLPPARHPLHPASVPQSLIWP